MKDWQSQAHVKWGCKYLVVIVPKYRRKVAVRKDTARNRASPPGSVRSEGYRVNGG